MYVKLEQPLSPGRMVTDVVRELGISSERLRGWVKKAQAVEAGGSTAPIGGSTDERDEELKRLRKLTAAIAAATVALLTGGAVATAPIAAAVGSSACNNGIRNILVTAFTTVHLRNGPGTGYAGLDLLPKGPVLPGVLEGQRLVLRPGQERRRRGPLGMSPPVLPTDRRPWPHLSCQRSPSGRGPPARRPGPRPGPSRTAPPSAHAPITATSV